MSNRVKYKFAKKAIKRTRQSTELDPRLVALVRLLARGAADRDYEALLAEHRSSQKLRIRKRDLK